MALSKDRQTQARTVGYLGVYKVKGSTKIYQGALVSVDSGGYAIPASNTASTKVIGRADETVDNTGADGAKSIRVQQGVFKWKNSGSAAVVQATVGSACLVEDDETVTITATQSIKAGVVMEIDADGGIWVATFPNGGI